MLSYTDYLMRLPLLNEVSEEVFDSIVDRVETVNPKKLPLNTIFNGKLRVVVPLNTSEIHGLNSELADNGFTTDFAKGIATKEVQTQQGTKKQPMKIGRAIELLVKSKKIDQKWWDYWNRESGFLMKQARENPKFVKSTEPEYSIIISRSPVDLLRMSDFTNIQSCHSEGGSYFQCAIQEAADGGAIAYLVDTADLKKVPDLQAKEIFADPDRSVRGIHPDARMRIRLFSNDAMQLGIPEKRIYGTTVPGFREAIRSFLMKKQEPVLQGQRPKMKEFQLRGGSYHDNMASTLFNDFFGDQQDTGDVGRQAGKNEEDAVEAFNDTMRREMQSFDNRYNKDFKNPVSVSWNEGDEHNEDGRIDFYWNADVMFEFPGKNWNSREWHKYKSYEFAKLLNNAAREANFEDVHVDESAAPNVHPSQWRSPTEDNNGMVKMYFQVRDESSPGHPDQYREFIENIKKTYDEDYTEMYANLRGLLIESNILTPGTHDKLIDMVHNEKFQHFSWDDEHPYESRSQEDLAIQSEKIDLMKRSLFRQMVNHYPAYDAHRPFHNPDVSFTKDPAPNWAGRNETGYWPNMDAKQKFQLVQKVTWQKVKQWWDAKKRAYEQQPWLPGMTRPPMKAMEKMMEPQLHFDWSHGYGVDDNQMLAVRISFPFNWKMTSRDVVLALRGIHFIDQNFDRFVNEIHGALKQIVGQEIERWNAQDEKERQEREAERRNPTAGNPNFAKPGTQQLQPPQNNPPGNQ